MKGFLIVNKKIKIILTVLLYLRFLCILFRILILSVMNKEAIKSVMTAVYLFGRSLKIVHFRVVKKRWLELNEVSNVLDFWFPY